MDLRKLRVLVELERRETVSAVAAALHLTPSAVSQQLAALGRELGVTLTEPAGRRLRLTAAAKVVLAHAGPVFAQVAQLHAAVASFRQGEAGQVALAGFATTLPPLVLPAAALLQQRRPLLRTSLAEADPPASYDLLTRGRTDVVIAVESRAAPLADTRFEKVSLMDEAFDVALPQGHRLADAPTIQLLDLASESWIFATMGMCQEIPLAACAAAGFTPRATHAIGDWEATFAAVALGMGISLVPRLARPAPRTGVVVRTLEHAPRRHVFAAVRPGSRHWPHIADALRALRDVAARAQDDNTADDAPDDL